VGNRDQPPIYAASPFVSEERIPNLADIHLKVSGNFTHDPVERPDSNSTMTRHNQVVLPVLSCSQPHMTALLSHNSIAEVLQ
jgi:hypothetical protein